MKNKRLTAINRLRLDDYIREMFNVFGINIADDSGYNGFIRVNSSFTIWLPILEDNKIVNWLHENCKEIHEHTFADIKWKINQLQKSDPGYFEALEASMKEIRSHNQRGV